MNLDLEDKKLGLAPVPPEPPPESPEDRWKAAGAPSSGFEPAKISETETDAGFWDVMGAAWQAETIRTDAHSNKANRRHDLAMDMEGQLPAEARTRIWDRYKDFGDWASLEQIVVEEAAKVVAVSPEAAGVFAGYPLSIEDFDTRINKDRKADLDEAEAILNQPGGGIAEFIGASARAMTDETSLALLPFGAGGLGWRMIAAEAALGAAGEAAVLPKEYEVASELGLQDPDPVSRIAMGAALGGGIAGAIVGGVRGVALLRDRAAMRRAGLDAARPADADPLDFEAEVDSAEAGMRGELTPQERLAGQPRPALADPADVEAGGALTNTQGLGYNEGATLRAIIMVESGGRADAQSSSSSARGLGQFIGETWMTMVRTHRPDLLEGRSANEVLALRDDPALNAEMTRLYMRENSDYLAERGIEAGPGEIYLAHFMGPGGAAKALSAPMEAPLRSVMSPKQIAANAGIRFNGKKFGDFTIYDLRMWARSKMRGAYDPNARADLPTYAPTSRGYTGGGQVAAGDGFRVDVEYEVVDAASLLRASGDLQPRDRSRIASDAWIADTAARLDPAQLMPSPTADRGAPIVGPDNVIESGNGRFGAITRAYERHPDRAMAYRGQIEAAGFAIPEGVERPVLVARRRTELSAEDRARFAIEAQDSGVAVMTPTEMARASSRAMSSPVLARLEPGQPLRSDANADFVRSALQGLPRSARNAMFDASGLLNSAGERQLREALFARAWPDPDILARFTETDAGELKSLMEALERAAPAWAALKADIEAGIVDPAMDISDYVLDAMRLIGAARDLSKRGGLPIGKAVTELLDEVDLLEGAISPLTAAMVRKFWKNGRAASADEVAGFLSRYAEDARKAGATGGMFDSPSPREVLSAIDRDTFGDLPEDLGQARGYAQAPAEAASPHAFTDESFDAGAGSPEAEALDTAIIADLDPPRLNDPPTPDQTGAVREEIDAARADLGDALDGFEIDLPDGTRTNLREMLDDLDADHAAEAALDTCLLNPAATFAKGSVA